MLKKAAAAFCDAVPVNITWSIWKVFQLVTAMDLGTDCHIDRRGKLVPAT